MRDVFVVGYTETIGTTFIRLTAEGVFFDAIRRVGAGFPFGRTNTIFTEIPRITNHIIAFITGFAVILDGMAFAFEACQTVGAQIIFTACIAQLDVIPILAADAAETLLVIGTDVQFIIGIAGIAGTQHLIADIIAIDTGDAVGTFRARHAHFDIMAALTVDHTGCIFALVRAIRIL